MPETERWLTIDEAVEQAHKDGYEDVTAEEIIEALKAGVIRGYRLEDLN